MTRGKKVSPAWTRLDVDIIHNSHMQRLMASGADGYKAFALYIESFCWSARNLTDGLLPDWYRPAIPSPGKGIKLLLQAGVWIEVEQVMRHGLPGDNEPPLANAQWLIKDYAQYGVTRAEWEALIEQRQGAARARWDNRKRPPLKGIK